MDTTKTYRDSRDNGNSTLHARPGSDRPPYARNTRNSNQKPTAKGHDAVLKALQDSGRKVQIKFMSDGTMLEGKIVGRDKFTITLLVDTRRFVIFKHAIEMLSGEEPQAKTDVVVS